jgi:CheY-like chemotaxis protein
MEEAAFKAIRFLFIDDDEISIMGLKRSMQQLKLSNPVDVARDGVQALEILRAAVNANGELPPFITTLDLSMPRMGGLEFLEELRRDPVLKKTVVFVVTTSDSPEDIESAYGQNVAGYIVKENPTETLRDALSMLKEYSQLVVLST